MRAGIPRRILEAQMNLVGVDVGGAFTNPIFERHIATRAGLTHVVE